MTTHKTVLATGVGDAGHSPRERSSARHVDDAAFFPLLHKRQDGTHHLDRDGEVDGDDLVPNLVGNSVGAAKVVHDPGHIDQHVNSGPGNPCQQAQVQHFTPAGHRPKARNTHPNAFIASSILGQIPLVKVEPSMVVLVDEFVVHGGNVQPKHLVLVRQEHLRAC
jgi:hypothetical protein